MKRLREFVIGYVVVDGVEGGEEVARVCDWISCGGRCWRDKLKYVVGGNACRLLL